jgi:hypothetical protein
MLAHMVHKNSRRFFNVCPRGRRKSPKERLKDFTAPRDKETEILILPQFDPPEVLPPPRPPKTVDFTEIKTDYDVSEFKLLRAVMLRAYQDVVNTSFCRQEEMRDARTWILSSSTDVFSFLWMCEHLDISDATVQLFRKKACSTFN